ncbi:MAG: hypothetical protein IJX15_04315, partial [Ruminiclostridium sp.]|nr:hypothetical protein [Ruminiclostridium sp.]
MSEIKFSTSNSSPKSDNDVKKAGKVVVTVIVIFLILVVGFNCFTIVNEGFIGVKYRFGQIVDDSLTAGL